MAETFESERLIYRSVEESDEPFILSLRQSTESHLNFSAHLPVPQGKRTAREYREGLQASLLAAVICHQTSTPWTATENFTPVGILELTDAPKERHHRTTNLTITIARDYQGQGYGTECIKWALDWAFRRAALRKVSVWCYEYNTRTLRLFEKMGFIPEARLREHIWHDGRFWDQCGFSILEREWKDRLSNNNTARSLTAPTLPAARINTTYTSPYRNPGETVPQFRPVNGQPPLQPPFQLATPISAITATSSSQSRLPQPSPARDLPHIKNNESESVPPETPVAESIPRTPHQTEPHPVFEFTTLKESTVTVAELWKEWHEGFPEEGRPSVEWMEERHKGNWRKKQFGAPGASCQYYSQRKRIIDEVKHLVERGDFSTYEDAIARLDHRMILEGMPTLNKLANELKRDSGVQKRRRYS